MAHEATFEYVGRWGIVAAAVVAAGAAWLGHDVGWHDAAPELFGVLVEIGIGGIAIGWLLNRSRLATEKRELAESLIKRINDLASTSRSAKELLIAHRSARTWGEQMRRLLGFDEAIDDIVAEIKSLYDNAERRQSVGSAIAELKQARGTIHQLADEYRRHHDEVGWLQDQFEKTKKGVADWEAVQVLHAQHWTKLQSVLTHAAAFAGRGNIGESPEITTLEGRLLQAATILWHQFKPAEREASPNRSAASGHKGAP